MPDTIIETENGPAVITDVIEAEEPMALPALNDGLPEGKGLVLSDRASAFLPVPLEDIRAVAEMLSSMPGVRKEFQTAKACEPVVLQAALWRVSPLFVLQSAYMVSNNAPVGYEAKLIHAVIIANGPLRKRPRLRFGYADPNNRTRANRFCEVTYWVVGEEEPIIWPSPTVAQIKTKNSPLWFSDTDLQLGYYTCRAAARLHFPDVLGSAYTREEVVQIVSSERLQIAQSRNLFDDDDDEAEFDGIEPTSDEIAAHAAWETRTEKRLDGEQDSRDPRDDPANKAPAPGKGRPAQKGSDEPVDLAEIRAWVMGEQTAILAMSVLANIQTRWTTVTGDNRWGRLKTYSPEVARAVINSVTAHIEKVKGK